MTPLIEVGDLHVRFRVGDGIVEAVKGASLTMWPARTLALVGESGSGKTVIPGDHAHPAARGRDHVGPDPVSRSSQP